MSSQHRHPDRIRTEETTSNPTLYDFYADMNNHATAEYARVAGRYIIEWDQSVDWVTVWEAVSRTENRVQYYISPEIGGNTYEWDAVARYEADDHDDARKQWHNVRTGGVSKLRRWCQANPYNGPRTPYAERDK